MGLASWTACTRSDKAASPAAKVAAAAPSHAKPGGSAGGEDGSAEASANQHGDDRDIQGDWPSHVPSPEEILQAQKLLGAMVGAYQQAASYSDNGEVQVSGRSGEVPLDSKFFFSVAFARPNKIRMQAYNGTVVGDGKTLHALIDDLPNQVLEKPSPEKLSIAELFADKDLASALSTGPTRVYSWVPIQALLLLTDDPLKTLLYQADKPYLLRPEKIGPAACDRVAVTRPDGQVVFWLDRKSKILRRFQYPAGQSLNDYWFRGTAKGLTMVAEYRDAQLGARIDPKAFEFQSSPGTSTVASFLPPDVVLLGKPVPSFKFTAADGKAVTSESLKGRVTVLNFWATKCEHCPEDLHLLDKVRQKYASNDKVVFKAVNIDPPDTDDQAVRQALDDLKIGIPLVRDAEQACGRALMISAIPTTVVLDAQGNVESYETGVDERLQSNLPEKLDKLLAGNDLAKAFKDEQIARLQADQKRFADWIRSRAKESAYWGPLAVEVEVPHAEIAAKSDPQTMSLRRLWTCKELKKPGNIMVLEADGKTPRILVFDGAQAIAEIDARGKVVKQYPIQQHEGEIIAQLRTATDKDGRRWFAASGSGAQQLHLFDGDFKFLLSYPADALENPHPGITDFQLADLDGDGRIELLVSYWRTVGIQRVTMEGQRTAVNRTVGTAYRMALLNPDEHGGRNVLCTNERGILTLLTPTLKTIREIPVPQQNVQLIVSADLKGDGKLAFCGLAPNEKSILVLGLTDQGDVLWKYPVALGMQEYPIEPVSAGQVLPDGPKQWLVAGCDGSIHFLSGEGKVIDHFNYGAALSGLAAARIDGKPLLLVATPEGLDAWEVQVVEK
jgi:thiol-disulfide isomerase/thioredoxin/outer membrane lipoprotein-sorting protein